MRRSVVSVLYHTVSNERLPWVEHLYPLKTPDAFERDLEYLKTHWHPVSHADILAHVEGGTPLPPNAVSLTFDDGFSECYSVVRPLLLKHGIPCTFFVITGVLDGRSMMFRNKISLCLAALSEAGPGSDVPDRLRERFGIRASSPEAVKDWFATLQHDDVDVIDAACDVLGVDVARVLAERKPYLGPDEIRLLHSDGFTIGAHTVNHPRLWLLPDFEQVVREIATSCNVVAELTGTRTVPFAFPFNGLDLSRDALERLRRDHPQVGLMYDTNHLMRDRDFIVNRVPGDLTPLAGSDAPGISWALKRAYALEHFRSLRRRLRGRGGQRAQGPSPREDQEVSEQG